MKQAAKMRTRSKFPAFCLIKTVFFFVFRRKNNQFFTAVAAAGAETPFASPIRQEPL